MTNAPFLSLAELFGSRDQFWDLSQTIVPVRDVTSDALANAQLVGSDATGPLTANGAAGTVAVTSLHDCYLTSVFLIDPTIAGAANSVFFRNAVWLRNTGSALQQCKYLWLQNNQTGIGIGAGDLRTYELVGIPFGVLIRAGDVFSVTYSNASGAALTAGAVLGYRGFQGPPA